MLIAFLIVVIHFVADFICQTDKMAQGKSKSNYWLTVHVLTYTVVSYLGWIFCFFIWRDHLSVSQEFLISIKFIGITIITHWVTDYVTSRINSSLWQKKKIHWFFVGVGADQVIHYGCLFFTYEYLIG